MKTRLLILFLVVLFLPACGNSKKNKNDIIPTAHSLQTIVESSDKPVINVFIENSGSMDGYVSGATEFEQAVYNYLTDIEISGISDTLNLFYINSRVIPQGSDISDFIENLGPSSFRARGGNRGVSDISNVLESVLSETQENEIALLVTDGIFSPGRGEDASVYLVRQQIEIRSTMAEYLRTYPNTAVIVYQLSSQFTGFYYNRLDEGTRINSQRPFYIWVIGDVKYLEKLTNQIPVDRFIGSGVQNSFSITAGEKHVSYAVKMGSGKFDLDKKFPKTTIKNLRIDTKGRQNTARFSVNANLSGFLLSDNYLTNSLNYEINNRDFDITIKSAVSNPFGYTHQLNLSSRSVHKGTISIKLKTQIPQWVEEINDDDGSIPLEGKTYGIKHQIHGIYEAFTFSNNYYTEIIININ